jgi:hypothetical protein
MNHLTVTLTRAQRLKQPEPLPEVTQGEARSWFHGWWHGIGLGFVIGLTVGGLVVQHITKA